MDFEKFKFFFFKLGGTNIFNDDSIYNLLYVCDSFLDDNSFNIIKQKLIFLRDQGIKFDKIKITPITDMIEDNKKYIRLLEWYIIDLKVNPNYPGFFSSDVPIDACIKKNNIEFAKFLLNNGAYFTEKSFSLINSSKNKEFMKLFDNYTSRY